MSFFMRIHTQIDTNTTDTPTTDNYFMHIKIDLLVLEIILFHSNISEAWFLKRIEHSASLDSMAIAASSTRRTFPHRCV